MRGAHDANLASLLNATLIVPVCGPLAEQFGSSWGGAAVVAALIHRPQPFQGRCKNTQYLCMSAEYHVNSVSLKREPGCREWSLLRIMLYPV